MFGEDDLSASKENALIISYEACKSDLLVEMVNYIGMLEFESRKDLVQVGRCTVATCPHHGTPGSVLRRRENRRQWTGEGCYLTFC